ncbi:MAG: acetyl-CoA C-acyltransferase, partial [Myxococcota bacterium]
MAEAWIIDAARTPRGKGKKGKGALTETHPQELLAEVLRALPERSGMEAAWVDDVVAGCVSQAGDQGANLARNAVLSAGWPDPVTGVTLNRFCGSGLQAANFAAMGVMSGMQDMVVAGGVESMSRQPIGSDGAGIDGNNEVLRKRVVQVPQGISADLIATREGFSREDLDRFALRSQQRAEVAQKEGYFAKSLVPVNDANTGETLLATDEYPRHGATLEALGTLGPAFEKMGGMAVGPNDETLDELARVRYPEVESIQHQHTAGHSSGIGGADCHPSHFLERGAQGAER